LRTTSQLHEELLKLAGERGVQPEKKGGAWLPKTEEEALWVISHSGFLTKKTCSRIWPCETPLEVACRLLSISPPTCQVCSRQLDFRSLKSGWKAWSNDTCSQRCAEAHPNRKIERSARGKKARQAVKNLARAWSSEARAKREATKIQKYSHKTGFCEGVEKKRKQTLIEKYECDSSFLTPRGRSARFEALEKQKRGSLQRLLEINKHFSSVEWNGHTQESTWQCNRCSLQFSDRQTNPHRFIRCPACDPPTGSLLQFRFLEELKSQGIAAQYNTRKVIAPFELDIWVPEHKVGIEVNGLFWHSFSSSETKQQREAHLNKWRLCKQLGIRLFTFFEDELVNKHDICLSMVLNACGKSRRHYARSTVAASIPLAEARSFLLQHHLHGVAPASFAVGLRDKETNELLMVATLGKNRFGYEGLELIRLATAKGVVVIGGFSKLLKFLNTDLLMTYSNRLVSMGDTYNQFGKLVKEIPPGYTWWNGVTRINRAKSRRSNLWKLLGAQYDETKTEAQNMFDSGWRRVWDAGHLLFSFSR
jgi:hypothetical protein